ncbi:MAG: hypothetical protein KGI71_05185, partial [Patescibacteria group bacterium]|nr:hypothetical protein [Patescibacteria group bacterium]
MNVVDSSGALGGVQQLLIAESTPMGGGSTCIPTPQKPCDTLSSSSNIVSSNSYPPGTGFSAITGPTQPYSPEGQVNASNAANALWLLTCPSAPGSGGADQYFTANPNFGGDACLQHPTSYTSIIGVQTSVTPGYYPGINYDSAADCWDCSGSTSITASPIVGLMTQGSTQANAPTQSNVLGFTAQADNAISSTFSNSSYAYQLPAAQTQHALWTWSYEMPTMLPPVRGQGPVSYSPSNQMLVNENNAGGYGWQEIIISCGYSGCTESMSSCSYSSYSYSGNSTIYYALNGGATFMEASGSQFSTPIMPFFSYRIKVPAPFGQQLNLSYDIFSPSQYQNPSNNIDALPVDVGSQFFVTYNNIATSNPAKNQPGQPENADKGGNLTLAMAPQSSFASQWGTPKMTVTERATDAQWDARNMQTNPSNGNPYTPPFCQMAVANDMNGNPIFAQYFTDSLYCRFCQDPANTVISYGTCVYYQCDKHGQNCVQKPGSFPYPTYFSECNQMSYSGFTPPDQEPESSYPWCQPNNGGVETVTSAVANAISIQAIPTDYIFVLNRSADSSYHISVLQLIPQGRYDVGKPNLPTTTDPTVWYIDWVQYWKQVIQAQADYMYLVGSYDVGSLAPGFTPINMSVDYTGNVFLVGTIRETINQNTANVPAIAEITGVTTGNAGGSANIISPNGKFDNTDSPTMSEIAVSPTGQNVFVANQSVGYVYVYSGSAPFAYQNQIDLSYSQSNPATKQTSALNINYWLESNGLYNQQLSWLPSYLQSYSPQQNTMLDAPTYHHPVGLQDVNGYLYVMDNWAGGIDLSTTQSSSSYQGVFFSALVLRAMNSSGLNIPLSPAYFNDLFSSGTCSLGVQGSSQTLSQGVCTSLPSGAQPTCAPSTACTLSTTKCYANGKQTGTSSYACDATGSQSTNYTSLSTVAPFSQNFYPPFGWIISANVTAATLTQPGELNTNFYNVQTVPGDTFSACVASSGSFACNFSPADASSMGYSGTFQTIGPHVLAIDSQYSTQACVLWVFCTPQSPQADKANGDVRGAFAPYYYETGFSVSFNQSISMLFTNHTVSSAPGSGCVLCSTVSQNGNPNLYNELFFSSLNVQNYTSLFDGNSQFSCYSTAPQGSGTGCSNLQSVQYMQPPLYNMPDPFKYLESLGSTQYLSFPEFQSSGLTTGIDKNAANSQAQQCAQTGSCGSNSASQIVSQAQGSLSANPGLAVGVSSPETVNITVTGDVLVPYTFSDVVHQSWSNFKNGMCCYSSSGGRVAYHKCQASSGGFFRSPPGSYTVTEYTYTDAAVSGNSLVLPVEGGYTYLQDLFSSSYLHVNTSTVGIVPPQIYTLLQSDRLFSDILINMTTNNMHGGNGNQYIINATHSRN